MLTRVHQRWSCGHFLALMSLGMGNPIPLVASQELEAFYTKVHGLEGRLPLFPPAYPTSALLGAVVVVDCLEVMHARSWKYSACCTRSTGLYTKMCQLLPDTICTFTWARWRNVHATVKKCGLVWRHAGSPSMRVDPRLANCTAVP